MLTLADALRVLELNLGASLDEVKIAHRRLALRWHPDKNPDAVDEATERCKEINSALDVVKQYADQLRFEELEEAVSTAIELSGGEAYPAVFVERWRRGEGCDVHVRVVERDTDTTLVSVHVHREVLLAGCQYVGVLYATRALGLGDPTTVLSSIDLDSANVSAAALPLVLEYVYTGRCSVPDLPVLLEVLHASRFLDLAALGSACCDAIEIRLVPSNTGDIFTHAETLGLNVLKEAAQRMHWHASGAIKPTALYAMGGLDHDACEYGEFAMPQNLVMKYSPWSTKWTLCSPMNEHRASFEAAALNGMIYVAGGVGLERGLLLSSVERYDPAQDKWFACAPMRTTRRLFGLAALGGKLYAVGGQDADGHPTADVDVYDPATDSWSKVAPMTYARDTCSAAAVEACTAWPDGRLYVFGSSEWEFEPWPEGFDITRSVEVYDPSSDSWADAPPMPESYSGFGEGFAPGFSELKTVVIEGKIYIPGEYGTDVFDTSTQMWDEGFAPMLSEWSSFGAAALEGGIFAVGGSSIKVYAPDEGEWIESGTDFDAEEESVAQRLPHIEPCRLSGRSPPTWDKHAVVAA